VLLAVKAFALEGALADVAPAVGADTMIVPFLNGMRHVEALVGRFGERAVLGGVCVVATMLEADGRIVQLGDMQELAYGERNGTLSERVRALDGRAAERRVHSPGDGNDRAAHVGKMGVAGDGRRRDLHDARNGGRG